MLTPLVTHTTVHPHSPQLPYGYARKLGFLVSHSAPAKCQVLCKRISFNQHIALQKDRLGRALVVPTDRSPTQISLSQKREFIAHIIDKSRSGLQACVSLAPALSPNLPHPGIGWALPTQQEGCPRQPRPRWPFQPSVPGEERCLLFVCRANAWGDWLVLMTVLYLRNGQGGGQPYLARAGHMLTLQQDDGWARAEGVGATRTRKTQRDCIWSAVVSIIFPFYKLGNGGLERLGDSPGLESQMGFKPMSVSSTQSITRPSLRVILSPN